jgi:colicin import membrane protein
MKMRPHWHVVLCAAALALPGSPAGAEDKVARSRIEASFKAESADCQQRFVVTACIDDARQRRREALAELARREQEVDAIERQRRAAQRQTQLARKQEETARRPGEPASAARPLRLVPSPAASAAHRPAGSAVPRASAAPANTHAKQEAYARREAAIQAHKDQVAKRNAERASQRPRAEPLPDPASSIPKPATAASAVRPASAAAR